MRNKKLIIILSVVAAFVLIIIVCGATFLVRDIDAYSYYVDSPEEYDQKVIDASGIKMNSSIFFLDEKKIKERIENEYNEVGVINIERKFPSRVTINYVVYKNLFQYLNGDKYYQCYSSGRVGGSSSAPIDGAFIVRPRDRVSSTAGEYFQSSDGYDRSLLDRFIAYMHTVMPRDEQIVERIRFVDMTRDGYFYIRTSAGCSIEIHGTDADFGGLLDGAWSIFEYPDPEFPVVKASGIIRAYVSRSDPDKPEYKYTYSEQYDEQDYRNDYLLNAA